MSETFVLDTVARFVGGTEDAELRISNAGTGTIYYDNEKTVSSSSNDGSIAAGASATRRVPTWIVATTQTPVTIVRTEHAQDSHNVHGYVGDLSNLSVFEEAPINVQHSTYGAVGDYSTNDTPAFAAALAAATAAGGGSVYVPDVAQGYYLASDLTLPANVTLFGDGFVLLRNNLSSYVITVDGAHATLRGIRISREKASSGAAVRVLGDDFVMEDCTLESTYSCVHIGDTAQATTPQRATIRNNWIDSTSWTGISGRKGIDALADQGHKILDNRIVMRGTFPGIEMWTENNLIRGNHIDAPDRDGGVGGITVGHYPGQLVHENTIVGHQLGIEVGDVGYRVSVTGNNVRACQHGIVCSTIADDMEDQITIADNAITLTDDWADPVGIYTTGGRQLTMSGNTIRYETALTYTSASSRMGTGFVGSNDYRRATFSGDHFINLEVGIDGAATNGKLSYSSCLFDNVEVPLFDSGGTPRHSLSSCQFHNVGGSFLNYRAAFIACDFHNEVDAIWIDKAFAEFTAATATTVCHVKDCEFTNVGASSLVANASYVSGGGGGRNRPKVEIRDDGWKLEDHATYSAAATAITTAGLTVPYDVPLYTHNGDLHWIKTKFGVVTHGTAAPVAGTWAVGDRVYDSTPVVGTPEGWICTVAGTSGTWVPFGLVDGLTSANTWAAKQTFGGEIEIDGALNHDGTTIGFFGTTPATQHVNITDAVVAHALNATFSDTEAEAALDALGVKVNLILDVLDSYGFTA